MQTFHTPTLDDAHARALWQSMQAQLALQGRTALQPARAWLRLLALSAGLAVCLGFAWQTPSAAWALFSALPIALLLAQFAFLGHDAGHRAVHRGGVWRGALGQLCMTVATGMAFEEWFERHSAHHRHCQDAQQDPDMDVSVLVALTLGALQGRRGPARLLARLQHWHVWFLSLLFAHSQRHLSQWRVLKRPLHFWRDLAVLALHALLWFGLPLGLLGVDAGRAALVYLVPLLLLGPYLAAIFWLNHIGMPLVRSGAPISFLEHQAATSRTVLSPPALDWFFGGLNYQIEHHLFPQVPSSRLAHVQPVVQSTLLQAGVAYNGLGFAASVRAVAAHFRQIAHAAA
ncbi:MAG: fatty acid desaturase [Rhodoferax sp.]|nr:fatty acid desaturase [Rhodoferax sp.]